MVFGTIVGLGVGYCCTKLIKLAGAALAGWGGWFFGIIVNTAWLAGSANWVYWTINVFFALLFAIPTFFVFEVVIIISTALIGAIFMTLAVALYVGIFSYIVSILYLI